MADLEKDLDLEVDGEGGEIGAAAALSVEETEVSDAEETETKDTSAEDLEVASNKPELSQGDLSGFASGFPAGLVLTTTQDVSDLLKKLIAERHPSGK